MLPPTLAPHPMQCRMCAIPQHQIWWHQEDGPARPTIAASNCSQGGWSWWSHDDGEYQQQWHQRQQLRQPQHPKPAPRMMWRMTAPAPMPKLTPMSTGYCNHVTPSTQQQRQPPPQPLQHPEPLMWATSHEMEVGSNREGRGLNGGEGIEQWG
jgi:hypothetical protein